MCEIIVLKMIGPLYSILRVRKFGDKNLAHESDNRKEYIKTQTFATNPHRNRKAHCIHRHLMRDFAKYFKEIKTFSIYSILLGQPT